MSSQARQVYLEGEILQADPVELVRILYKAALDSVFQARRHLQAGNVTARSRSIARAGEILNELALAVNHENGGVIARNLVELYDYMQRLLMDANFRQVEPPLEELQRLLSVLLDAWEQVPAAESMLNLASQHVGAATPASLSY